MRGSPGGDYRAGTHIGGLAKPERAKELAVQLVAMLSTQKALGGQVRHTRSAEARRVEEMWPSSQEHAAEPSAEWELAGQAILAAEDGKDGMEVSKGAYGGLVLTKRT